MTKESWGLKRRCPSCGAPFYDMRKNPAACPKCGHLHDIHAQTKSRRSKSDKKTGDGKLAAAKVEAKAAAKPKLKKPVDGIDDIELGAFEEIEPIAGDEDIEQMDDIDDIETLDDLEEIEESAQEEPMDDDIALESAEEALIDVIDDGEEDSEDEAEDEDDDEDAPQKPSRAKKTRPKAKPAKPAQKKK